MSDEAVKLERVRMAIAEAGFDPLHAYLDADGMVSVRLGPSAVPDLVCWRAFFLVVGPADVACWDCWSVGMGEECEHEAVFA